MDSKKVMLLGIAFILLGIACNSSRSVVDGVVGFVGNYAHWVGILITIVGLFLPSNDERM